ncbi:hypothetical protein CYMTET_26605 [Cymbomonas tetramitiformis]|uniref:Uncharacterized protein n=1 Tax=Cymbomonas tetramitiformis TaxID=36881 RepID=A0AAE0FRE9_9CHLO|nr:hypothetical protein CYMTET_26605 [Cymbomonas tetramitiformis]
MTYLRYLWLFHLLLWNHFGAEGGSQRSLFGSGEPPYQRLDAAGRAAANGISRRPARSVEGADIPEILARRQRSRLDGVIKGGATPPLPFSSTSSLTSPNARQLEGAESDAVVANGGGGDAVETVEGGRDAIEDNPGRGDAEDGGPGDTSEVDGVENDAVEVDGGEGEVAEMNKGEVSSARDNARGNGGIGDAKEVDNKENSTNDTPPTGVPPDQQYTPMETLGQVALYNVSLAHTPGVLGVFIHIQKTAGSAFLHNARFISQKSPQPIDWFPRGAFSYKALGCHAGHSMHCNFAEVDSCIAAGRAHIFPRQRPTTRPVQFVSKHVQYLTVLRHPVEVWPALPSPYPALCAPALRSGWAAGTGAKQS